MGKVTIQNNAEVGKWGIDYIRMVDKARNQSVYSNKQYQLVGGATFEVIGD